MAGILRLAYHGAFCSRTHIGGDIVEVNVGGKSRNDLSGVVAWAWIVQRNIGRLEGLATCITLLLHTTAVVQRWRQD